MKGNKTAASNKQKTLRKDVKKSEENNNKREQTAIQASAKANDNR